MKQVECNPRVVIFILAQPAETRMSQMLVGRPLCELYCSKPAHDAAGDAEVASLGEYIQTLTVLPDVW
jgi:hypothetical protein